MVERGKKESYREIGEIKKRYGAKRAEGARIRIAVMIEPVYKEQ